MTNHDHTLTERGTKALRDAKPLARQLRTLLDAHDPATADKADTLFLASTARMLALTADIICLNLHPDSAYATSELPTDASIEIFVALRDAAEGVYEQSPLSPDTHHESTRDLLDAFWDVHDALLDEKRDEDAYTIVGFWDNDEVTVTGVILGDHAVHGGDACGDGGPFAEATQGRDADAAERAFYASQDADNPDTDDEHCACGEALCAECSGCSECGTVGECLCSKCVECGECLGCLGTADSDTLCTFCLNKNT